MGDTDVYLEQEHPGNSGGLRNVVNSTNISK